MAVKSVNFGSTGSDFEWATSGGTEVSAIRKSNAPNTLAPPFSDTADWISETTINEEALYLLNDDGSTIPLDATITLIQLDAYMAISALPTADAQFKFVIGGPDQVVGPVQNVDTTFGLHPTSSMPFKTLYQAATNPVTGLAWTRAQVFSTEFGIKRISGPGPTLYAYVFYVLVQYTAPASVSIIGSGGVQASGIATATAGLTQTGVGGIQAGVGGIQASGAPDVNPYHAVGGGPPELSILQWGLHRFELKPRPEETS